MPLYNHQPKKNRIIHEIWWFALLFARIGIKYFVKPNFVSLRFNVYSLFHVVKYECEFNWKQEIQKLGPIIAIINGAYKKLVTSKCHEIAQTASFMTCVSVFFGRCLISMETTNFCCDSADIFEFLWMKITFNKLATCSES